MVSPHRCKVVAFPRLEETRPPHGYARPIVHRFCVRISPTTRRGRHCWTSSVERPLLLIDVRGERGRTLRAVPNACLSAVGNMDIDNLTFDDHLDSLDDSGVHRISDRYRQALAALQAHHQPGTDIPRVSVAAPAVRGTSAERPVKRGKPSHPSS
ncbi:DUF6924 domain-containing protein [Streptomyces sp. NPDC018972]|uniref:DUF6924 domain-containing protein n=1 Tax=Streptomyces sp. NPDC018972 TaxID=3365060 RepID=UPI0037A81AB0